MTKKQPNIIQGQENNNRNKTMQRFDDKNREKQANKGWRFSVVNANGKWRDAGVVISRYLIF